MMTTKRRITFSEVRQRYADGDIFGLGKPQSFCLIYLDSPGFGPDKPVGMVVQLHYRDQPARKDWVPVLTDHPLCRRTQLTPRRKLTEAKAAVRNFDGRLERGLVNMPKAA